MTGKVRPLAGTSNSTSHSRNDTPCRRPFVASYSTKSQKKKSRRRSPTRGLSTCTKSKRSRHDVCSIVSSATRPAPSCGRPSRKDCRPVGCKRWRCASSWNASARFVRLVRSNTGPCRRICKKGRRLLLPSCIRSTAKSRRSETPRKRTASSLPSKASRRFRSPKSSVARSGRIPPRPSRPVRCNRKRPRNLDLDRSGRCASPKTSTKASTSVRRTVPSVSSPTCAPTQHASPRSRHWPRATRCVPTRR